MVVRRHYNFIDYLRFFAMSGVVYLHIACLVINGKRVPFGSPGWELLNAMQSFAYSGVAVFFMISGFLLLSDSKTGDVSVLLKKRLPRLCVPLIGWTGVAAIWVCHLADDLRIGSIFENFIHGLYGPLMVHFWFIFSLIALYMVSPLLYAGLNGLDSRAHRYIFALIVLLNIRYMLYTVLPENVYRYLSFDVLDKIEPTSGILSTFVLGWYLGRSEKTVPNRILLALVFMLFACITLGSRSFYDRNGVYEMAFHSQTMGFEVCLAACIFLLFKQNIRRRGRFFDRVSVVPLSFPIYFMHIISMELFIALGWMPESFMETLLFTAVNIVFCYLLIKTAASIKPICYLAVGMSFDDACRQCNWQYSLARLKKTENSI